MRFGWSGNCSAQVKVADLQGRRPSSPQSREQASGSWCSSVPVADHLLTVGECQIIGSLPIMNPRRARLVLPRAAQACKRQQGPRPQLVTLEGFAARGCPR